MTDYTKLYIDGGWVSPDGTGQLEVIDPTTETVFATVPGGSAADIDRAVAAARAAFPEWSTQAPLERAKQLRRIAEAIDARKDEIADIESHEIGMPRTQTGAFQAALGVRAFATAAETLETFEFEDRSEGLIVREPIGVVGAITPWNFPLNQIGAKVAYAMAAGCTVVLKPSEVAPVNAFILA
ncbi:MAG TPA: aldehyde dehydrogenase family protein, partial [Acidimicrobiales bacterium]|nr:aldehyde dehydrogenase family protein [Acidimicrobiales bacterium]